MFGRYRGSAAPGILCLALSLLATPAWAGRIVHTGDAGYEITRIVSQARLAGAPTGQGVSETIAPWETTPLAPIAGETLFYGTSNLFPEFGRVSFWDGARWIEVPPTASDGSPNFTFRSEPLLVGQTPPPSGPTPFRTAYSVVFRFPANRVNLIQNRAVLFQIFPIPPGPHGDTVESLNLRSP
jgi:hypothetical protein